MPSFVNSTLRKGEKIKYEGKLSLASMLFSIIFGFIFLLNVETSIFGIFLLVRVAVLYLTTEIAITSKRVAAKQGFIRRQTIEIRMEKVESVQVNQGIMGRILNYGDIVISGTGVHSAGIKGIRNPLVFRSQFIDAQEDFL